MAEFVTVAVYDYPHEITILRHLLDQAAVVYFFENETLMNIVPMYSQAIGGIKIKVHPKDAENVLQIIKNLNDQSNLKIV